MASTKLLMGVFVLDVTAFVLAVVAELKRSTARVMQDSEVTYNYCAYDSDIATNLGFNAALLLVASQVLTLVTVQCFCSGKALSPQASRAQAIVLYINCWVTFLVAEACLLVGAVLNSNHTKYRTIFSDDPPACYTLQKGVFGAGAAFILFNCIASMIYQSRYSEDKASLPTDCEDASEKLGGYTVLADSEKVEENTVLANTEKVEDNTALAK